MGRMHLVCIAFYFSFIELLYVLFYLASDVDGSQLASESDRSSRISKTSRKNRKKPLLAQWEGVSVVGVSRKNYTAYQNHKSCWSVLAKSKMW